MRAKSRKSRSVICLLDREANVQGVSLRREPVGVACHGPHNDPLGFSPRLTRQPDTGPWRWRMKSQSDTASKQPMIVVVVRLKIAM